MIIIVHQIPHQFILLSIIIFNMLLLLFSLSPLTWSFREHTPFPDNAMLLEVNVDGSKPIIYLLCFFLRMNIYFHVHQGARVLGSLRYHQTWLASPSFIAGWRSFFG